MCTAIQGTFRRTKDCKILWFDDDDDDDDDDKRRIICVTFML